METFKDHLRRPGARVALAAWEGHNVCMRYAWTGSDLAILGILCCAFGSEVINDGEVTALAGKMMVNQGNLMGISMGSSEGGGYCDADGNLLGWINELCYIQLDLNPEALNTT